MSDQKVNYINHQLNNSMSKTAYSFSRSGRFPVTDQVPLDNNSYVRYETKIRIGTKKLKIEKNYLQLSIMTKMKIIGIQKMKNKDKNLIIGLKKVCQKALNETQNLHQKMNLNLLLQKRKLKCHHREGIFHKTALRIFTQSIRDQGIDFTILWEYKQMEKGNTQCPIITRNVKSPNFGKVYSTDLQVQKALDNVGPGLYVVENNSPGKYAESKNRNYTGYTFSKSPRKGFENKSYDSKFGPGMYDYFSQFGPKA